DVMEMSDHEVGLGEMYVGGERGDEQAGEAAHGEEADEPERVQHRRVEMDVALVHGADPIEDLDGRRHGYHITQDREDQGGEQGCPGHEHVVAPDEKTDHGDTDARPHHERVAEERLAREGRNDLTHDAEPRQDHDVDGRVGVEPEEVLEQQWIPTQGGIEYADVEETLES